MIGDVNLLPTCHMPRLQLDITYLKGGEMAGINPKLGLNPDTEMPTHLSQITHELGICKATISQKNNFTGKRHTPLCLVQQGLIHLQRNSCTTMFNHLPNQRDCTTAIDHRSANHTVGIP